MRLAFRIDPATTEHPTNRHPRRRSLRIAIPGSRAPSRKVAVTAPSPRATDDAVSYSVRACPRCSARMVDGRSLFGLTVWECPSCGKRAR
jgi:DNA-directed RNA polymerase subunit RPC12/RpoP